MAKQSKLFVSTDRQVQTAVISRHQDFDALFDGFTELKAVSYVSSASLLLDFFDNRGFQRIELLVGENIDARQLREDLAHKGPDITERLASEVADGRLRILVPRRTVHSKLYIARSGDRRRLIVTSANLTESARRAARQTNYAWYMDVEPGDPMLKRAEEDYQAHCKDAALFMGDLLDLFQKSPDMSPADVVSVWLGTEGEKDSGAAEARAVVQEMVGEAFAHPGEEEQPVINISLPTNPDARQRTRKLLSPLGIEERGQQAQVSPARVIRYVEEAHGVPLMRVSPSRDELVLGFRGEILRMDQEVGPGDEVEQALAGVEAYINTIDLGQCSEPEFAKTSMYEALLYVMAAPFANEHMRERRRLYGLVNRRGPAYLYIYGPSENGKSTFLRYALKLLTGNLIDPLTPSAFTKPKTRGVQAIGTCFPLMFDDMTSTATKTFEDIAKSHWETEWDEDSVFPQLIFTSNSLNLKDWAKSRMKRVDFDVHFVSTTRAQTHLAGILEKPNPLFRWFAWLYLERLRESGWLEDDELATARRVMRDLYDRAGRDIPRFFPDRPLEDLYDPDLRAWKDAVRRKKASIHREPERTTVTFSEDLEHTEVREYQAALPQTVKSRRTGKSLVIESPQYFHRWLDGATGPRTWWRRLLPGGG